MSGIKNVAGGGRSRSRAPGATRSNNWFFASYIRPRGRGRSHSHSYAIAILEMEGKKRDACLWCQSKARNVGYDSSVTGVNPTVQPVDNQTRILLNKGRDSRASIWGPWKGQRVLFLVEELPLDALPGWGFRQMEGWMGIPSKGIWSTEI